MTPHIHTCVCHTLHCISLSSYLHALTYYITYTLIYTLLYTHTHYTTHIYTHQIAYRRMINKRYSQWKDYLYNTRQENYTEEYTRRLQVSNLIHSRQIEELQVLLLLEREQSNVEKVRIDAAVAGARERVVERALVLCDDKG